MTDPLVVCMGEALIDFVAEERVDDVGEAATFHKFPGGAVANVAAGLARLGVRSRFITKLGKDPFGRYLKNTLEKNGIDTSHIIFTEAYQTGLVFVALDDDKVPSFSFYGKPSADMMLGPNEVGAESVSGAEFFHVGTVSMVTEKNRDATFKLIDMAEKDGVKVSFDPNLRLHLFSDHDLLRDIAWEVSRKSSLIKLNRDELLFMTGDDDYKKSARKLLELGAEAVVVTLGPEGAYYLCNDGDGMSSGFEVDVKDTTGAGDGFVAGLLSRLCEVAWPPGKDELENATNFANAVAAIVCTKVGAVSALPDIKRVEDFLSKRAG